MSYFIIINDIQQGPFTIDELRARHITSDTLVWAEGMPQWVPAWQVAELKPLLNDQATPPPPPVGSASDQSDWSDRSASSDKSDKPSTRHRGCVWALIVLVGLLVFMGVTNPSRDRHRQAIRDNVTRGLAKALGATGDDALSQGVGVLGQMLAGPMVDGVVDQMLDYHNYLVFSTATVTAGADTHTVSYGLCGHVFTADEDAIAKAVTRSLGSEVTGALHGALSDILGDDGPSTPADPSATAPTPTDSLSLGKQIGNVVIDHVGRQVKKQIEQNTDSATSSGIGRLVDDAIDLIKGL